jgi:hypothetical protein
MNRHDLFIALLARREELTIGEETMLGEHLEGCAQCRERAAMYRTEDEMIRSLPLVAPPSGYRHVVRETTTTQPLNVRRVLPRVMTVVAVPIAACLLVIAFVVFTTGRRATPANAFTILQRVAQASSLVYPHTGTSDVSYQELWYLLPPQIVDYAGTHRVIAHWAVRDATHFRVDIHILSPQLDRGSITVVLNGTTLTSYDDRTGKAYVMRGLTRNPTAFWQRVGLPPDAFLSYLKNGATMSAQPQVPAGPAQSIGAFIAALQASRAPAGIRPRAHVVGHAQIAGHVADIVDFAPVGVVSVDSGGCYSTTTGGPNQPTVTHPPTGPCHHYRQAVGWARVWVERDHPTILRYQEFGLGGIHNVLGDRNHFRYTVTSITYHRGPSSAALAYIPPVPATVIRAHRTQLPASGTNQGESDDTPAGYVRTQEPSNPAQPNFYSRIGTTFYGPSPILRLPPGYGTSPLPYVPGFDVLFSQVRRWHQVFTSWHGQIGIYVTGPYVLVQERKLARGLPSPFTTGPLHQAGTCSVWTGRYADGQHWLALSERGVSVIISSNKMSVRDLTLYAAHDVCS